MMWTSRVNRTLAVSVTAFALGGLTLGGLTGCGAAGQDQANPTPSVSPSESALPSTSPPASPGGSKTPGKDNTMELRGTVESGVEAGCLILKAGGKTYNLIGGDQDVVKPGATVVVRGSEKPDMVTTCQQGVPFQVVEARRQ